MVAGKLTCPNQPGQSKSGGAAVRGSLAHTLLLSARSCIIGMTCMSDPPLMCLMVSAASCMLQVRMGIWEGIPASISPHPSSGRADVFGSLVNR